MRLVYLDTKTLADLPEELAKFSRFGDYTGYSTTAPEQVVERLAGAQVAIVNKVYLGEAEMAALPDLKLICISATGMNNVDLVAAERHGIRVTNVSGYSTDSVAQLTFSALFAVAMDLIHLNEAVYDGTYANHDAFGYWRHPFYELRGKRFGIVGLGAIGQRVGEIATAFGAEVVYHSTSGRNTTGQPYPHLALGDLLETSDVVALHCPLNEHTRDLIGEAELQRMKSSAHLVNMARGGIVTEPALVRALNEGWIAGAAFDVFTREPIAPDHPFMGVKERRRLLLTPHMGWASVEARVVLLAGVRENIEGFASAT